MRYLQQLTALALVASVAACADSAEPNSDGAPAFAAGAASTPTTGRHLVKFSGTALADFNRKVEALGGRVDWTGAGLAALSGLDESGRDALAGRKDVALIIDDPAIAMDEPLQSATPEMAAASAPQSPAAPQTAFFFPRQWHLRAVGAQTAWAAGELGSSSVTAYILDTGIDYTHADLSGLVDRNRSIDLLGTFNVQVLVGETPTIVPFTEADTVRKYFPGSDLFTDLFYHGTHVAATVSSNALAAAGVTSRTKLVAVKVCAYLNICPLSSVLQGVLYAADNGADIVNMSLGGGFAKPGNGTFVGLINDVFNYAASKGTTVVVAAGNAASDLDHNRNVYSTYCNAPGVICVSATGPTSAGGVNGPWTDVDAIAPYSNFGRSAIDLAAPGGTTAGAVWAACSRTSMLIPICRTGTFVVGLGGTSMASPHVAGTAAMLVPTLGRNPAAIQDHLKDTADDLGQAGTDPFYGKGRLNVARAVGALP
ncbi:MAG TPA: S8 family serine peptidase [Gemmatimonadales bacterium]|nr:S8 family serine peptidase [Gemmatimonadales bacterium]